MISLAMMVKPVVGHQAAFGPDVDRGESMGCVNSARWTRVFPSFSQIVNDFISGIPAALTAGVTACSGANKNSSALPTPHANPMA